MHLLPEGKTMRLTVFSDYSLRVLIYLGLQRDGLATISEIAEAYGISRNHLMKVVQQLGANNYVETVRGKGGGLRLARAPQAIRLGDVLRSTEEEMLVECFSREKSQCCITPACTLPGMLREASANFFSTLDKYTLADLLRSEKRLGALLSGRN
jgi:Rrf2 family nitric oxide-sensitive transcriptional repressor